MEFLILGFIKFRASILLASLPNSIGLKDNETGGVTPKGTRLCCIIDQQREV